MDDRRIQQRHRPSYFNEAAKAFEASHPGTTVQIEVVPWDNLQQQKLTTDISAGANADLSIIGTRWLLDYVSQGIVAPARQLRHARLQGPLHRHLPEAVRDEREALRLAHRRLRPRHVLQQGRVQESGLRRAAQDLGAEFKTAADKIKASGDGVFPFGLQGKEIETDVYFYYSLWSYGGDIIVDKKSGLDSAAAMDGAKLYKGMIDARLTEPGVTSYSREDVQNLFKQGKVATVITAPFLSNQIKAEVPKLNYGVAPIPDR